jgi:hypothetical protein
MNYTFVAMTQEYATTHRRQDGRLRIDAQGLSATPDSIGANRISIDIGLIVASALKAISSQHSCTFLNDLLQPLRSGEAYPDRGYTILR